MTDTEQTPRPSSLALIAERAGVSISTASRVLNGSSHPVSEEKRRRVHEVAEEVGYRPSALAQALVKRQSRTIGVIGEDNRDPYFAEITRGIEERANAAGYMTVVCNANRRTDLEVSQLHLLLDFRTTGIVFLASGYTDGDGPELEKLVAQARASGMRVLALGTRRFVSDVITYDNEAASYDLTKHLIDTGARRVSFVTGLPKVFAAAERHRGYARAMEDAGLEPHVVRGNFGSESGASAALRLLADGPLPDAIIGANDQTAIGVMTALRSVGVEVPNRLKVAGIGATDLADLLDLTSVGIHLQTLGGLAANYLLGAEVDSEPQVTVLPHAIQYRRSTSAANA